MALYCKEKTRGQVKCAAIAIGMPMVQRGNASRVARFYHCYLVVMQRCMPINGQPVFERPPAEAIVQHQVSNRQTRQGRTSM